VAIRVGPNIHELHQRKLVASDLACLHCTLKCSTGIAIALPYDRLLLPFASSAGTMRCSVIIAHAVRCAFWLQALYPMLHIRFIAGRWQ